MNWLALSFGQPLVLLGLAALPVIWWLLRLTPPRPQEELFPPLGILARVTKREETPHRSPWWLTLLRLAMAALVILALAEPTFSPRETLPSGASALALVMDNGWASAPDWPKRVATAERLIADAGDKNEPVILAFTAEKPNADIGPFDAGGAADRLRAVAPRPIPVDRGAVYQRVAEALRRFPGARLAVLSDGLGTGADESAFRTLLGAGESALVWAVSDSPAPLGLTAAENQPDSFAITAVRPEGSTAPRTATVGAYDEKGRRIADATLAFAAGEAKATAKVPVPFELRNDFSSIAIDGERQAAAIRVLDDSSKRRRVGIISQGDADQAQPLLSPLYYINKALQPFADLIQPKDQDLAKAIPELIGRKPAMIIMADIGTLPASARQKLVEWLREGGTLVRFAGPRLAAATENDEELLPVRLRLGERSLGGALSWTTPQPVAEFPKTGPFSDLTPPREVTVSRQVLAEPTPDLAEHTWSSLADGTPLVTGAARGKGTLVLFHVTPEATWSNLPISGTFVAMLRRIVQMSRNQGRIAGDTAKTALAPYRMIAADGTLTPPPSDAKPLLQSNPPAPVTIENPPGLYGSEDGVVAHNLLPADATLTALQRPPTSLPVREVAYALDQSRALKGGFLAAALLLMALDTLAVLWMGGLFARRKRQRASPAGVAATLVTALVLASGLLAAFPGHAAAEDRKPGDEAAIEAISKTRIAYVVTGDPAIDDISRAGILGLSRFLIEKTALEPGDPAGVDIAKDELSFYPLIYWPVDAKAPMPSEDAIARIDAYMKQGGTVLFDTRDQFTSGFDAGSSASPATERLRDILSGLNVPPLEPVPSDHVLTKSFYILPEFPGRYDGGPLWVEASAQAKSSADRPVRTGDGVSPILITGNDFAGAWAIDDNGDPLLPTVPNDPMQRVYAYRAGVNIMMYMLTGNYKSDQVHVPILLERLGQ